MRLFQDIKHLNVQGVKEVYRDQDCLIIVSEYCDGGTLNQELRGRAERNDYFSEEELLTKFSYLCIGLKKLHDMNIVHR